MARQKTSKEEIVEGALDSFIKNGYNGTTVRGIAQSLGISHGSIFNYFPSKADLALCIVNHFFAVWFEESGKYYENPTPLQHFAVLAATNFSFMLRNRPFARFLCDFMSANQDYYLENTNPWIAMYVSAHSSSYMASDTESPLDTFVLNNTSMKLISMLVDDAINIQDACVYITAMDNFLWNLGGTPDEIKKSIDTILSDEEPILLETVERIEATVFNGDSFPDINPQ